MRYILPAKWLTQVIKYYNNTSKNFSLPPNFETKIKNSQFLGPENSLSKNIQPQDISLIIFEIMKRFCKNIETDYVIQVEFDPISSEISLEKPTIKKRKNFLEYIPEEDKAEKIEKVYLVHPEFTIKGQKRLSIPSNKEKDKWVSHFQSGKKKPAHSKHPSKGNRVSSTKEKTYEKENAIESIPSSEKKLNIVSAEDYSEIFKRCGAVNLSPKGLINSSIYCFMNTSLQCLCSIPELNWYFQERKYEKESKKRKFEACRAFSEFIDLYAKESRGVLEAPRSMFELCYHIFRSKEQEDCQEYLIRLIETFQKEVNENKKYRFEDNIKKEEAWRKYTEVNRSIIDSIFTGLMQSTVYGIKCKHTSTTYDPFIDFSLPVVGSSLKDCLRAYFKEEDIEDYKCETCKEKTKVINFFTS